MAEKNKAIVSYDSDYDTDNDDHQDEKSDLELPLEKLNLGPKKKLLVISINGLLLYRDRPSQMRNIHKYRRPDAYYSLYSVFLRPFSEDFMKFCLERFEVGIWSSAREHNAYTTLNYAIGSLKSKLLFVWDQKDCTDTGFMSLENEDKRLFFKDLNKVFQDVKKGGPYTESNTLMIDDTPYKTFLNPPNTAIFLEPYDPLNKNDSALDPKGELCSYLEGVAAAQDVQSYVKENPFGQPAITSSHVDWDFYSKVKERLHR
ncbi:hypothetical protein RIF29_39814 [Crotalaria pallida]|uniref:Mitochondrial import inner membrane translocase subunit TIM50 n=1 Tax=Crotalaria pallida TaxID=3830 RepID=A0AAN9E2H7_CROPI